MIWIERLITAALAAAVAFWHWLPENVEVALGVGAALMVVDWATGVWGVARLGGLSSSVMRRKMAAKLIQYLGILAAVGAPATLAKEWAFFYTGVFFVIGCEVMSILENCLRLESVGISMGYMTPLLDRVRGYFAVTNDVLPPLRPKEVEEALPPATPAMPPPALKP